MSWFDAGMVTLALVGLWFATLASRAVFIAFWIAIFASAVFGALALAARLLSA